MYGQILVCSEMKSEVLCILQVRSSENSFKIMGQRPKSSGAGRDEEGSRRHPAQLLPVLQQARSRTAGTLRIKGEGGSDDTKGGLQRSVSWKSVSVVQADRAITGKSWHGTRDGIHARYERLSRGAALVGLLSIALTLAVNEILIRGSHPHRWEVEALKGANSLCALCSLLLAVQRYRCTT
jgi:hypothetical protein